MNKPSWGAAASDNASRQSFKATLEPWSKLRIYGSVKTPHMVTVPHAYSLTFATCWCLRAEQSSRASCDFSWDTILFESISKSRIILKMPSQTIVAALALVAVLVFGVRWLRAPPPPAGCQEPKSYPHKDPILGLDLFLKVMEQMKAGTRRQAQQDRVRLLGSTFKSKSLGRWSVSTIDPLNAKEMFVRNAHQWGVADDRWQAMEPFVGTGFMNADGDSWKVARGQLEHCFTTSNVTNVIPLREATDDFLERVCAGKSVDLAPLLDEMVKLPEDQPLW